MASDPLDNETPRSGGLLPSQGIEWSLIWLAVGVLGLVFLFFSLLGTRSDEQPTYERDSQIAPRPAQERQPDQPEIGTGTLNEST